MRRYSIPTRTGVSRRLLPVDEFATHPKQGLDRRYQWDNEQSKLDQFPEVISPCRSGLPRLVFVHLCSPLPESLDDGYQTWSLKNVLIIQSDNATTRPSPWCGLLSPAYSTVLWDAHEAPRHDLQQAERLPLQPETAFSTLPRSYLAPLIPPPQTGAKLRHLQLSEGSVPRPFISSQSERIQDITPA